MRGTFAFVVLALAVVGTAWAENAEPAMAEAQLVETASAAASAAVAGDANANEWYTPPAKLGDNYSMRPVLTKQKNIFQSKRGVKKASIVSNPELQNIVQYDFEALQRSVSRAQRLKRMRSGETARPKLLPAHYHTSTLVSPVQDKVTADVRGSEGVYVEPEVIGKGRIPRAPTAPEAPRFFTPQFVAASKKPLSKLSSTVPSVRSGPKIHYHHAHAHRSRRGFGMRSRRGRRAHSRRGRRAAKGKGKRGGRRARRVITRVLPRRSRRRSNFPRRFLPKALRPQSRRQRRQRRQQRKQKKQARRSAQPKAQGQLPKPRPPRALARRSALRGRTQRRIARRAAAIARRRAQIRRERARQVAAVIGKARARSPTGKPAKATAAAATQTKPAAPQPQVTPAVIREADKEARQLAEAATTIKAVKADTSALVMGQKQLIDYARTATRSNPIAERSVKLDEQILRHIDRLEKELSAMAEENRAMRALQRANLEQLKVLTTKQQAAAGAAAPAAPKKITSAELAKRIARNVKSFPHLRAVAVSITPDTDSANVADVERFAQVHADAAAEAHEEVVDEFHASLAAGHDTEQALDDAISEQLSEEDSAAAEVQHTDASAGESDSTADTGAKSEEEVAMEKLMGMATGFIESHDEAEAEADAEEETSAEEESEAADSDEAEAEEESEDEEEAEEDSEEESEEESEDEEEAEDEAEAEEEVDSEDAEAVALIDADSTAEQDILRLASHNAALVEEGAHRVMAQAESESESEVSASTRMDVEVAEDAAAEAEAAAALGLPEVPHSVPKPVHDDLSEVAAEVEAEFGHNQQKQSEQEAFEAAAVAEADAAIADSMRFAQVHTDSEDAEADEMESEAEAEVEAEQEADASLANDAEYMALMKSDAAEDAELNAQLESELANEDAADVDIAADVEASAEDGDALEATVLDTADAADSAEQHHDLQGLRSLVASLAQELGAVKAQGKALAEEEL